MSSLNAACDIQYQCVTFVMATTVAVEPMTATNSLRVSCDLLGVTTPIDLARSATRARLIVPRAWGCRLEAGQRDIFIIVVIACLAFAVAHGDRLTHGYSLMCSISVIEGL